MVTQEFNIIIPLKDLAPIVKYPQVVNIAKDSIILNATESYDPINVTLGTQFDNVECSF